MEIHSLYSRFLQSKGVNTDTRNIAEGELFFALKGDNFNGNLYASQALEKGALLAVIDEEKYMAGSGYLLVENVLQCLQELASHHRKMLKIPLIAITGSNGKTTTKELIAKVLSSNYNVLYTQGNLNNHIGVPLSILKIREHDMAIIEMGANHPGEIAELSRIADPDYGIITNIGKAHLEGFGSPEGVLKAKSELYEYIGRKNGKVFLNKGNELLKKQAEKLGLDIIGYGNGTNSLCEGEILKGDIHLKAGIRFREGVEWEVNTRLAGKYNLENVLAAACIGKYFGIPESQIIEAVEKYEPDNNRSQFLNTGKNQVILDAYNANPSSMMESIQNFSGLKSDQKALILGDMKELGKYSSEEHRKILDYIQRLKLDLVLLSGEEFYSFKDAYPFLFFKNTEELYEHLSLQTVYEHLILIKSSRAGKIESIIKLL